MLRRAGHVYGTFVPNVSNSVAYWQVLYRKYVLGYTAPLHLYRYCIYLYIGGVYLYRYSYRYCTRTLLVLLPILRYILYAVCPSTYLGIIFILF